MECLDANAVQDLMSDALEAGARAAVMGHLDTCADCRELVGVLAKDTVRESSQPPTGLEATALPAIGLEATQPPGNGDVALAATLDTDRAPKLASLGVSVGSPLGRTLGKYKLVERLGSGAMGVVYRAEDRDLSRNVAVKVLHRPDDALAQRLVREAQSMAQVNHPNVVVVYDVSTSEGTTYIAMELVEGVSLRQWQQTEHTIPELIEAYVAAGRGLAAAHAAGIVHRDFKPDNVLVGNDGRLRVTDFGLAAARSTRSSAEPQPRMSMTDLSLTRSGTVLGTPAYMAPEQFEGGNVDARTDQFNFCVALHEALYAQRPFSGRSFEELGDNVTRGILQPAPANARVSGALRRIVLRGLSTRPGDRYPTMDHLLDELLRDRAKPWRRAAYASASLAVLLGLGFAADQTIHDRLRDKTERAFRATTKQTNRTMELIVGVFNKISDHASSFGALQDVSSFREQSDFDLGDAQVDAEGLDELREKLASADWSFTANIIASGERPSVFAAGDKKGRLLYTSASGDAWMTDLAQLPWIRHALQTGEHNSMRLMPYSDPALVATRILGPTTPNGLALIFTRTGKGGDSLFIQVLDADDVLAQISLGDDDTLLSLVAPGGTSRGNVPGELLSHEDGEYTIGAATYQVAARPIVGPDHELVGRVVMASRVDGVLSLFPNARAVFAVAMLVAAGAAIGLYIRARQLSSV